MVEKKPNTSRLSDPEVSLVADVTLKPGMKDRFETFMVTAQRKNRAEDGNVSVTLFRVDGESDRYDMVERWKNQAALDLHLQQEHFTDAFGMLEEALAVPLSEIADHIKVVDEIIPATSAASTVDA